MSFPRYVKSLPLLLILLFNIPFADAQNAADDSVLRVAQKHTGDSTEVNALMRLGFSTSNDDVRASLRYFRKALRLAEHLRDIKKTITIYDELGHLYHTLGKYDSSLVFHRHSLTLALANNDAYQASDAYEGIAQTFLRLTQLDSARDNLQKGLSYAVKSNDYVGQSDFYNLWGNIFLEEGNDAEAIHKFIVAARLQDSLVHDPVRQSRALLNIANIENRLGNSEKALGYAREAQRMAEGGVFDLGSAYASQLIGRIYRKQKKLDEALVEYKKALDLYERLGEKRSVAETFQNIGNVKYDKGDFKEAQNEYHAVLRVAKDIANHSLMAHAYSSLGYVFFELKQFEKAIAYTDSSRIAAENPYTVLDAYQMLSSIYQKQNRYKEALLYFQKYSALKDSLAETSSKAVIEELEMKYQSEKKAAEIELLTSERQLQTLALSRQRVIIISIAIALIAVIVIGFLLINRYRVVNKAKRLIEVERVRNSIARDLHDDIGSTLSSINIMSRVALVEENGNAQNYLQRIGDQSARIMEDMGDMVWSINPRNDSIGQVITRMREFANEIFEPRGIEYSFVEKISEGLSLTADQRKNLFLIFKETINNAAKYSQASLIEISLHQQNNILVMQVKDNGRGFDEQRAKSGNGLRNLRERAKEIKGSLRLQSSLGEGTEIELHFPVA